MVSRESTNFKIIYSVIRIMLLKSMRKVNIRKRRKNVDQGFFCLEGLLAFSKFLQFLNFDFWHLGVGISFPVLLSRVRLEYSFSQMLSGGRSS